ncbi:hypothetical protein FHS89_003203 [Rubricella aquisinus]|uniref:Uncharacterized protein n=1 Tax=Rubricella aquisinus TaxID=2028108 RepID=A0A840X5V5_9RHOB|nr:hypothetical protein [Rubricella aquisinus]MBB5517156.1 hypothetical protein [Rubricella aquisinus]
MKPVTKRENPTGFDRSAAFDVLVVVTVLVAVKQVLLPHDTLTPDPF